MFEINGTMIRVKTDKDDNIIGVAHNKKFKLTININPGIDEDFEYFGGDGYSFIPYQNTTPIIGGISEQSNYYKKIKRQLGFLKDEKISIEFKNKGDKLKTELALLKMENQNDFYLEVLPAYMEQRFNTSGNLIYNGITPIKEELGKGIGDCDLTSIKYYNTPKSISEIMFGDIDLSSEYLATLPFPQYIEEFNTVNDAISEYPLIILKDGALDTPYPQQQLSNMIIWEQETISLNDIYIPIFTLVPNGVTKILQFDTEPVSPEDPLYGAWGNQPDGEPYPVYVNRYASTWISELGEWFGQISSLETGKRYCFILENEERMVESERDEINWYAGGPEDYIPSTESDEISITEEDTIYFLTLEDQTYKITF